MGIVKIENTTVGVSPDGISSVAADTPIPHQAIMSSAAMNVYYDGAPATVLAWPADIIMPVHPDMRLQNTTTCWVYGERSYTS